MRNRWRPLAVAVVAAVALGGAGCSIQPNSAPRDVPDAQRPQLETEPDAGQAIGAGRVFLLAGASAETRLRSVPREAEPGAPIIQSLLDGPNEGELDDGLQTALPSGLELLSTRSTGTTMTIDLSDEILNLNSAQLRVAIAQLVFTASEIETVNNVRILVDGTPRTWPDGRGTLRSSALSVYDFPDLAETSQPRFPPIPSPRPS
jgi:spore germination protein GerM